MAIFTVNEIETAKPSTDLPPKALSEIKNEII